ncbi:MAG: hypothetical protein ACWA5L_09775 [bacterium]
MSFATLIQNKRMTIRGLFWFILLGLWIVMSLHFSPTVFTKHHSIPYPSIFSPVYYFASPIGLRILSTLLLFWVLLKLTSIVKENFFTQIILVTSTLIHPLLWSCLDSVYISQLLVWGGACLILRDLSSLPLRKQVFLLNIMLISLLLASPYGLFYLAAALALLPLILPKRLLAHSPFNSAFLIIAPLVGVILALGYCYWLFGLGWFAFWHDPQSEFQLLQSVTEQTALTSYMSGRFFIALAFFMLAFMLLLPIQSAAIIFRTPPSQQRLYLYIFSVPVLAAGLAFAYGFTDHASLFLTPALFIPFTLREIKSAALLLWTLGASYLVSFFLIPMTYQG